MAVWPVAKDATTRFAAVSTTQTVLCGAAQVTKSRVSSADSASPSGGAGRGRVATTERVAGSKRSTRWPVAPATYSAAPLWFATRAVGESGPAAAWTLP